MTEKLKMEQNPLSATVERIKEICPAAVTSEGKIDFEELKTALSDDVAADAIEKYEFTWVGKNAAKAEANRPIRKTLRPVVADSKNWDTTKNLYIEGDNLDALKLLQESYLGKVKMIYIDPPYNTGNDFVYCDEFAVGCEEYLDKKGQCDSDGNRLFKNTETNGRFHSDWCNMMYPRLKIARDLLSDDGVVFISIDDHEVANLKKICDEIFGADNFVAQLVWEQGRKSMAAQIAINHEYCIVYCKNKHFSIDNSHIRDWKVKKRGLDEIYKTYDALKRQYGEDTKKISKGIKEFFAKLPDSHPSKAHAHYNCVDNYLGIYYPGDISQGTGKGGRFDILHPVTNKPCKVPTGGWRFSETKLPELLNDHRIHFGEDETVIPCIKRYLIETTYEVFSSVFYKDGRGASKRLESLLGADIFEHPKDEDVMKVFVSLADSEPSDSIILDFFSGSATTAHAVMQLNAEDGGNRRFIMVQLPEKCDADSEAFKAGYKNICEIGMERIRRAGEKIKAENPDKDIDIGFRVLRIDSTNMKDVYYKPSDTTQKTLLDAVDNIKADRSDMDLLFGVMVYCGLPLDMPIETKTCDGKKYYVVNGGDYLVACFEPEISEKLVYEIANLKPTIAVFRDSSFADAKDKVNVTEIFKNITGRDDCVKVL